MISLLHPSRSRPDKAWMTYTKWAYQMVTHLDYRLSLDFSDSELPKYDSLFSYAPFHPIVNNNKSVVDATNAAAKASKGDILVYLSDDFDCPQNWDVLIEKEFEGVTSPMLLKIDDCLQPFRAGVVTIPVMNRALYELLGYFWHPDYLSMHVDVDLYETCRKLNVIRYAEHLKFPHNHYSNGKAPVDETYKRSEANWNQGAEVLKRRRAQGFPV